MGSKLKNPKGKNLYEFWTETVTKYLNEDISNHDHKVIINLASEEYFKVLKTDLLNTKTITPKFYELRNGSYKMIGFFAKKARGLMARFIIDNQLENPQYLKNFKSDGYRFDSNSSDEENLIFVRKL